MDGLGSSRHSWIVTEYLNTSARFIRRLIAERRIAFHKVGSPVRPAVAGEFVQAGRVEPITGDSMLRELRAA